MKTDNAARPAWQEMGMHALAYTLWLLTLLITILAVLEVREAVNILWVVNGGDRYSIGLANQVCLLVLGFVAFVYVLWLEHDYRESVRLRLAPRLGDKVPTLPQGRAMRRLAEWGLDLLLRRFAVTFALPLVVYLLSLAVYQITLNAM